jgi:RIO-like serine/threonine protein kinase
MQPDSLTPVAERILYTVWKLNAIGSRFVFEEAVKSELSIPAEEFREEMERLQEQVFINTQKIDGKASLSLTPLGLAILRQAEEDSLQELR